MQRILFLLIFSFTSQLLYCQSGWYSIYESSSDNTSNIFFLDINTGYYGGDNVLHKTTNGGVNWVSYLTDTGAVSSIYFFDTLNGCIAINRSLGYGLSTGNLYRTTNGGINWSLKYSVNINAFHGFTFKSDGTGFIPLSFFDYVGFHGSLHITHDFGNSWGMQFNNNYEITSPAFTNQLTGYISAFNSGTNPLLKSTDGGNSWLTIYSGMPNLQKMVFTGSLTGIAISGGQILMSANGGQTWISKLDAQNSFKDILSTDSEVGYVVGGAGEVFKTINGGNNWYQQNSATNSNLVSIYFPSSTTGYILGRESNNSTQILKTTDGGGPVGIQNIGLNIPNNCSLSQNYPNPFNPTTKIKFDISKSSFAEIKIYDILGNEVADLMHEQLNPGSYEVEWDASNNASGLYFYKLVARQVGSTTGDYVETKKMVLLK